MPDKTTIACDYLDAWHRKDATAIGAYFHPEVSLTGPMANIAGRDAVVASAARMFPMLKGYEVREIFAKNDQAICIYDFICAEPIGRCRTAELLTFDGDLIRGIELFFDARPFEAALKARSVV